VKSTGDTALRLFSDQRELLAFTTASQVTIDTFWFENNYVGEVHVTHATLAQGTHFSILGEIPHALPDTLKFGQMLGVIVQFSGDTTGFYHDSLTIEASQNLQSFPVYNLEAVYTKTSAGVASNVHNGPALLTLSPNPATGPVQIAIANASHTSVEVFDLLGDLLWSADNSMGYVWTPNEQTNGTYIVRASGIDTDGRPFTLSKRLILGR
jgi:hypothetical protein